MTQIETFAMLVLFLFVTVIGTGCAPATSPQQNQAEDLSLCIQGWDATENGEHKRAIELYEQCLETGNLSLQSLARSARNMGITYNRDRQFVKSIEHHTVAAKLNLVDPWVDYVNRGNSWSGLGEFDKAFTDYDKAQLLKPDYNEAYYNRGIVFEKMGDFTKAKEQFQLAYDHGLRSNLLYGRFVAHKMFK